jgi:hypothetical protein
MRRDARRLRRVSADLLILALAVALLAPAAASARRAIPDTTDAVHVWDDQLPDSMTDAQIAFVARHVDGTQKVSLQTARRLRAIDPGFLVLYYRLGIGDGPVPFRLNRGWASDYGYVTRHESWFWHLGGQRVLQATWNWYLMNPDSGWRAYWASSVLRQAALLGDDGVFADSLSVGRGQLPAAAHLLHRRGGLDRADRSLHALRAGAPTGEALAHPERRIVDNHARPHRLLHPRRRDDRGLRRGRPAELLRR